MADPNQKVSPQLQQFIMQEQAKAQVSLFNQSSVKLSLSHSLCDFFS